jgi:BirA family biotin operon repressor/biotin-[acetyl-CoA-carboxylase] ligase
VVGIGLNIAMTADQLPVPNATSLAIEGADTEVAAVRDLVLRALGLWYGKWQGESTNSTLRGAYLAASGTVGQDVVVTLSDGSTIEGSATDVDEFGRLVVGGQPVGAGDVTHVRR